MEEFLFIFPLEIGAYTAATLTIVSNSLLLILNINFFGFAVAGNYFYHFMSMLMGFMMISGIRTVI